MSPTMRAKLSRNIDYHVAMRDFYRDEDKKAKEAQEPQSEPPAAEPRGRAPRSEAAAPDDAARQPPKPAQSAAEKLAEMHGDVVEQLTAVIKADPEMNAIEQAQLRARPLRSPGANLKPSAGTFH